MIVENLSLKLKDKTIFEGLNCRLEKNKALIITGESGVGKSLLAKALIRLLGNEFKINANKFSFLGKDILSLSQKELRKYRLEVSLNLQDAELSLYPNLDIGALFHLFLKSNTNLNAKQRKAYALSYLEKMGFKDINLLWHSYANELSLGMARRVSLAFGLLSKPKILICDEITASLDKQSLEKIKQILKDFKNNGSLLCITHDFEFIKDFADDVLVLEKDKNSLFSVNDFLRLYNA